jgi:hypothetical protein
MGDLKVNVVVAKQGPRKWCAQAHAGQMDDTDKQYGPEEGVNGASECAAQRSVAVARALAALGKDIRKTKPFGALKPLRERGAAHAARSEVAFKVTPTSPEKAKPVPVGHGRQGAKASIYVTETLQHGEIAASGRGGSSYYSPARGCLTADGPARRDQVDLVFMPRGVPVSKHSTRPPGPGPALRFCSSQPTKGGFGPVLAVRDPREAQEIAHRYQACAKDPKADLEGCIVKAVGKKPSEMPLGQVSEPVGAFGKLKSYPSKRKGRR